MSRVLVTGGAGFIGSHVVDRLRAAGHEPVVFDLRASPHHAPGEVETVIGDIRVLEDVRRAVEGCDAVAHLAAAADVGEVAKDPAGSEELNARGTLNVLEAARDAGVQRVVYASTIWVYSDATGPTVDEESPLLPPSHLYTATKLAGELYCRSYGELYGLETTILRFGIPYGPRARPAAVVPAFVGRALAGEALTIAGTGEQTRRFVYVEDLAEGVVRGLAPHAANRTYNLVSDEDVSIRQIADTVQELIGDVEIVHTEGRAGDFGGVSVCGERAATELDWRAETSFREGVRRYIAWHREDADRQASVPARRAARLRAGLAGAVPVAVLALVAGAFAALMTHISALDDPMSLLGTMVLLGLPVAALGRINWARDRGRAMLVLGAMLAGALLVLLVVPHTGVVAREVREHLTLTGIALAGAVALAGVGRRLATASDR